MTEHRLLIVMLLLTIRSSEHIMLLSLIVDGEEDCGDDDDKTFFATVDVDCDLLMVDKFQHTSAKTNATFKIQIKVTSFIFKLHV